MRRATPASHALLRASRISIHALLVESDSWKCFMPTAPQYFYPRSPCGERREAEMLAQQATTISIHALLAESDEVSQHSPSTVHTFLSTLSLRRATGNPARRPIGRRHFYPRSPCGERLGPLVCFWLSANFYPRSPCGERPTPGTWSITATRFLSTLSLRRATRQPRAQADRPPPFLSTLSLRRATFLKFLTGTAHGDFYPRSPCGERLGNFL